jgi:hypothetical protein
MLGRSLAAANGYVAAALSFPSAGQKASLAIYSQDSGALLQLVPLGPDLPLENLTESVPALYRGVAYVGTIGAGNVSPLYAVRIADGTVLWRAPDGGANYTQPVAGADLVFSVEQERARNSSVISAFPAACSSPCGPLWTAGLGPRADSPASFDDVVLAGSAKGLRVWALPADSQTTA